MALITTMHFVGYMIYDAFPLDLGDIVRSKEKVKRKKSLLKKQLRKFGNEMLKRIEKENGEQCVYPPPTPDVI